MHVRGLLAVALGSVVFWGMQGLPCPAATPTSTVLQMAGHRPPVMLAQMQHLVALQLLMQGQLLSAMPLLERAIALNPAQPLYYQHLGQALEGLGKTHQALAAYAHLRRLAPDDAMGYYLSGLLLEKQGQLWEATRQLTYAVQRDPGNVTLHYDLGVLYAKQANFATSAQHSAVAMRLAPDFAEAFNNYGYAMAQLGLYHLALPAIDRALELNPGSAAALDSKGFVLAGLGRREEALSYFGRAIAHAPGEIELYRHYAETADALSRWREARWAYEHCLRLLPAAASAAASTLPGPMGKIRQDIEARLRELPVAVPALSNLQLP